MNTHESSARAGASSSASRAKFVAAMQELLALLAQPSRGGTLLPLVHLVTRMCDHEDLCAQLGARDRVAAAALVDRVACACDDHVAAEHMLTGEVAADVSTALGRVSLVVVLFATWARLSRALDVCDAALTVGRLRADVAAYWPMALLPLTSPGIVDPASLAVDMPPRVIAALVQFAAWGSVFAPLGMPRAMHGYFESLRRLAAASADAFDDDTLRDTAATLTDLGLEHRALYAVRARTVPVTLQDFRRLFAAVFAAVPILAGSPPTQPGDDSAALRTALTAVAPLVDSIDARQAVVTRTYMGASFPGEVRRRLADVRFSDMVTVKPRAPLVPTVAVEAEGTYRPDLLEHLTEYLHGDGAPRTPYSPVAPGKHVRPGVAVFESFLVLETADALLFNTAGKRLIGTFAVTAAEISRREKQSPAAYLSALADRLHATAGSEAVDPRIVQMCMGGPLAVVSPRGVFVCTPSHGDTCLWPFATEPAVPQHTVSALSAVLIWALEICAYAGGHLADGTLITPFAKLFFPRGLDESVAEWQRLTEILLS